MRHRRMTHHLTVLRSNWLLEVLANIAELRRLVKIFQAYSRTPSTWMQLIVAGIESVYMIRKVQLQHPVYDRPRKVGTGIAPLPLR